LILIGVIPASLLALALSWSLGWVERRLTPLGLRSQKA
jgi:ABC-type proline/glycine betaine transport system permease subunit